MNTQNKSESKEIYQLEPQSPVPSTTTDVQERCQDIINTGNVDESFPTDAVEYITRYLHKNMPNIFSQEEVSNISEYIDKIEQLSVDNHGQSMGERIQAECESFMRRPIHSLREPTIGDERHLPPNPHVSDLQHLVYKLHNKELNKKVVQSLKDNIMRCTYEKYIYETNARTQISEEVISQRNNHTSKIAMLCRENKIDCIDKTDFTDTTLKEVISFLSDTLMSILIGFQEDRNNSYRYVDQILHEYRLMILRINSWIRNIVSLCDCIYKEGKITFHQYQAHLACIYNIIQSHELYIKIGIMTDTFSAINNLDDRRYMVPREHIVAFS